MTVEFLKDHQQYKATDVANVPEGIGNYLVRVGVAKATDAKEKKAPRPEPKAVVEPTTEKKAVKDSDGKDVVEKVKKIPLTEKVKDAGPLEPVVNVKPDKNEVVNSTIETSEK